MILNFESSLVMSQLYCGDIFYLIFFVIFYKAHPRLTNFINPFTRHTSALLDSFSSSLFLHQFFEIVPIIWQSKGHPSWLSIRLISSPEPPPPCGRPSEMLPAGVVEEQTPAIP